jgi:hypothetical protein
VNQSEEPRFIAAVPTTAVAQIAASGAVAPDATSRNAQTTTPAKHVCSGRAGRTRSVITPPSTAPAPAQAVIAA